MTFRKLLWEEKTPKPQLLRGLTNKMAFSKSRWKTMLGVTPHSGYEREYLFWLFSKFQPLLPPPNTFSTLFYPFLCPWMLIPLGITSSVSSDLTLGRWGLANGDRQAGRERGQPTSLGSYSASASDSGGGCIPPRLWFHQLLLRHQLHLLSSNTGSFSYAFRSRSSTGSPLFLVSRCPNFPWRFPQP